MAAQHRRVGVLGGMFDPVHCGHLQAAELARDWCSLDEVRLVPCGQPVHRAAASTPAGHRCAMLDLAIAERPWLRVDRRECDSPEPSRTWATLQSLKAEQPQSALYFILGMDAFLSLPGWYRWRELFDLAHLVVIRRPEAAGEATEVSGLDPALAAACEGRWVYERSAAPCKADAGSVFVVPESSRNLSSTQVREVLLRGESATALLPPGVAEYIRTNHLYQ